MTIFLVLAICALVFLVLARPFRQAPETAESPAGGASRTRGSPPGGSVTHTASEASPDPAPRGPQESASVPSTSRIASAPAAPDGGDPTHLLDEKDRLFHALADLRFDYEAGKLSREDFEEENARLRARAAAVLRELEG